MSSTQFDSLQTSGVDTVLIGATRVTVHIKDSSGNVVLGSGTTVPTTGSGYAKAGLFLKTDVTTGTSGLYENVGTTSAASFNVPGAISAGEITLANGSILIGNGSGVAAANAVSGDGTLSNAGVLTVTGATAAFNIGTNETWTKEVNHTSAVATSTTANTAGGSLSFAGGVGTGTAAGGAISITGGASSNGTAVNPGAGGASSIVGGAGGTATTGTAGAGATSSVVGGAGGNSTGASSTAGKGGNALVTGGAAGNSSGGSDTGGAGASVILTATAGGTGATAGIDGAVLSRANQGALYLRKMPAPTAKTTDATLTAAELLSGWITVNQGGAATSTMTTPTGTQLKAALPADIAAGDCFDFTIINISTNAAEDAILAFGTDITGVGSLIVPSNESGSGNASGTFRFRYVTGVTFVAYRIT